MDVEKFAKVDEGIVQNFNIGMREMQQTVKDKQNLVHKSPPNKNDQKRASNLLYIFAESLFYFRRAEK